jgi:hypothetical protein
MTLSRLTSPILMPLTACPIVCSDT